MNTERLTVLANFLDALPPEKFDMSLFANDVNLGKCGTAGCAFGWATTIPEFQAAGLRLVVHTIMPDSPYCDTRPAPEFDGKFNFDAAEAFFDISANNACLLFDPSRYRDVEDLTDDELEEDPITPEEVASRIRHLVA